MNPLLAYKPKDTSIEAFLQTLRYPVLATPKIDGIRCIIQNRFALSRTLKPIPNLFIRQSLESMCPDWLDGELISGSTFQSCTRGIMTHQGEPDFTFFVFDLISRLPYNLRVQQLKELDLPTFCTKLMPRECNDASDVLKAEQEFLEQKAEGVMLRTPESPYKEGRSTLNEQYLVAVKRFVDDEATVIGFEEQLENQNTQEKDELGYSHRTSHQENLVPKGKLGALIVTHSVFGEFRIGTGFTDELRQTIWDNKQFYLNLQLKFKYQSHGVKDKPRIPVFLGFRVD